LFVLPSFDEFEQGIDDLTRRRIDLLSASILSAPFRAVGPRDRERFNREIVVDSLAPILLGLIGLDDRFSMLDLGCGVGIPSLFLASLIRGSSFIGIDSSQKRLAFGREIARSAEIGNIEFIESRLRLDLPSDARYWGANLPKVDLAIARAMAKPDLLLPSVISMMRGGLERFFLYTTTRSLNDHESTLEKIRALHIKTNIHLYRRSSSLEAGENDQSPLLDYALLELVRP
jgi:16S rRNA G527 N7-methylase RsmG